MNDFDENIETLKDKMKEFVELIEYNKLSLEDYPEYLEEIKNLTTNASDFLKKEYGLS